MGMAAKAIDTYGGVIRMNVLLADKAVAEIREQFPKHDPRYKIAKILGSEPRYFTLLDKSAFVATALGYKKGFVAKDGQDLTDAGKRFLEKKREEERAGNRGGGDDQRRGGQSSAQAKIRPVAAPERRGGKLNVGEFQRLFADALKRFGNAMENNDDVEFIESIKECRRLRRQAKAGGVPTNQQVVSRPAPKAKALIKRERDMESYQPPTKRGRVDEPAGRSTGNAGGRGRLLDPPELERKIEDLMRATASVLENRRDNEISLSELSTLNAIKGSKGFTYDHKIPLSKIYSVCYPRLFHSYVTDKNQTIIQLVQPPEQGPCPPDQIPEAREPRERERGGNRN